MTIRQGKILIVDDNEDILFTLKMLLRPRVENITTCSDPKEINRLVSRNQYDVILLDMNFTTDAVSGKEGFYWLERILEIAPDTVVILITAYSDTTIFCRSNGLVRSIESYRKVTGIPIPVLEIISVNYFLNDICLLFKNLEDKINDHPTTAHYSMRQADRTSADQPDRECFGCNPPSLKATDRAICRHQRKGQNFYPCK